MVYLTSKPEQIITNKNKIYIDNEQVTTPVGDVLLITTEGKKFLSLKELTSLIGYNYFNGEYSKFSEDIDKCYIENIVQIQENSENGKETTKNIRNIVGLEVNSNKIYKTNSESKLDYEYIQISDEILQYEKNLYISIDDVRNSVRNSGKLYGRKWAINIYV